MGKIKNIEAVKICMVLPLLIGGAIVVGGIVASGFLADEIGQVLEAQGANQTFQTRDDVAQALLRIGRPDKAQELLETTNPNAFSLEGASKFLGNTTNLALVAGAAVLILKPKILKGLFK